MADDQIITIRLLGSFQITHAQHGPVNFEQARLQALLACLLLHGQRPLSRLHLAARFWPDSTEQQARTNLRNLWHRLRRALPGADRFLTADELALQWRGDASCWLDVTEFENYLAQARSAASADEQITLIEGAVNCYGGDLLPGDYSDWLLAERERLSQAYGRALSQLAALHENRREYRQAIKYTQALIRHDPLHEPAYGQLMRLQALNNDRATALHTYHTAAARLHRELDVTPDRPLRDLYEQLLNQADLPVAQPQSGAALPLVGRHVAWERLQKAWRDANRRPHLLLISGEAGIGKTRLAEELVEWVARQGLTALTARSYAAEGDLPYAPIVAWLRRQPLPLLADPWLRELARLLPEILVERPDLPPPEPLNEAWQRRRLFAALAQALVGGQTAVLFFLDDIHWADPDTLDWLHFLLTERREPGSRTRLLVIATVRREEVIAASPLTAWQTGLARANRLTEITLGPLNEAATLALAEHVAQRPFDPSLAPLFFQGTEGHPLFIVEMVRAGLAQAAPATDAELLDHAAAMLARPTALPARVRQALEARLSQLSPAAQNVMGAAAVIGRAFTYDILRQTVDLNEDELVNCLDESWRRRIIREQEEDAYDFSHDKLREVAYAGLSRARRRWLHGRAAHALETRHAAGIQPVAGVIARHYEASGQLAAAVAYYGQAAAAARVVYAHDEALTALKKAIGLLAGLPPAVAHDEQMSQLQEQLGDLLLIQAQRGAARDAYQDALAHRLESEKIGRARLERKIGKTLAGEQADYAQVTAQYETAEIILGAPTADAGAGWWEEWCQIQLEQLLLMYWWQRTDDMTERLARVQPLLERHGTPIQRAALLSNLSRQLNRSGRFAPSADALNYARAALEALPSSSSPEMRAGYQFSFGFNLLWHGDHAEAEVALNEALAVAEQAGDITLQTRCLAYLVAAARRQGDDADVTSYARRCLALANTANMLDYIGAAQAGLAWAAWRRDDLAEAARLAQAALATWREHAAPYPLYWQALWPLLGMALAQERLAEAVSYARQLLQPEQQALPARLEEPLAAALAVWDASRPDETRDFLHHALTTAQQIHFS
jgi:DNA-binding SARP family transcriptional activator/DNA polymerase III delta prime subunit